MKPCHSRILSFHHFFTLCSQQGLSMSLNFMEICRAPPVSGIFAKFDNICLNVAVIMFFLIGQLVDSSGGLQFLAEFVVTAVGFLLGGCSTVSSNGLENWFCFFCLSSIAFLGYLFARVGVSTCIRKKKCWSASSLLRFSFLLMFSIWLSSIAITDLGFPTSVMIKRFQNLVDPKGSAKDVLSGRYIMKT
jgi:hypothetical protein